METVVDDFTTTHLERLGTFDVVLYLTVLYHMENPLAALPHVRSVTRELAVIETQPLSSGQSPLRGERVLLPTSSPITLRAGGRPT